MSSRDNESSPERKKIGSQIAQLPGYLDSAHDAIMLLDPPVDVVLDANEAASDILGYSKGELISNPISAIHPGELSRFKSFVKKVLAEGQASEASLSIRSKSGNTIPVKISATTMPDMGETVVMVFIQPFFEMASERSRIYQRDAGGFASLAHYLRGFAYHSTAGADPTIEYISQGVERITGKKIEEFKNKPLKNLLLCLYSEDKARRDKIVAEAIEKKAPWNTQFRIKKGDDDTFWLAETGIPILGKDGTVESTQSLVMDVTDHKAVAEGYQKLAMHDPLTKLPNRLLFLDRLSQAMAKAKRTEWPLAVFFIDLDNFKEINDTHGHGAGDEVLKTVSRRLVECLRETDTVARLSGDEFTVLLENTLNKNYSNIVAKKLQFSLTRPIHLSGGIEVNLTASIGICPYLEGDSPSLLLQKADTAMYQAKKSGKSKYQIYGKLIRNAP